MFFFFFFLSFPVPIMFAAASGCSGPCFEPLLKRMASHHVSMMEYNNVPCMARPLLFIADFSRFSEKLKIDDLVLAQELVSQGANIEQDFNGRTMLVWSIYLKNRPLFEYFLSQGADLERALAIPDTSFYREYKQELEAEKELRTCLQEQYPVALSNLLNNTCSFGEKNIAGIIATYAQPQTIKELKVVMQQKIKAIEKNKKEKNCIVH